MKTKATDLAKSSNRRKRAERKNAYEAVLAGKAPTKKARVKKPTKPGPGFKYL